MHEWHTSSDVDIASLIEELDGYEFIESRGTSHVENVRILTSNYSKDESDARTRVTRVSYGSSTAYICVCAPGKVSKTFEKLFDNFLAKYHDYNDINKNISLGYNRPNTAKVTCPRCKSMISLAFGRHYRHCPVCGSLNIISDATWNKLKLKREMMHKASSTLAKEASKLGIYFVGGIEWYN